MLLTTKEMAYLQPSFADRTPLSLFSNINISPDGSENASLTKKGVLQGNGYSKEALELLMLLAKPERCTRLVIKNDFALIEKYTYKSGNNIAFVQNNNGEMLIDKVDTFTEVITGLGNVLGMSKIKTVDISVELEANELLVLLAVIDIFRKNTLMAYAGKPVSGDTASLTDITDELSGGTDNGLLAIFTKNYNAKTPPSSEVETLLKSLAAKNCIASGQGYKLTDDLALLAKNFLIPQTVVLYETFGVEGKEDFSAAGSLCVAAGLYDIVSFSFLGNLVQFSTVSATQLLLTIEDFLYCPAFVKDEAPAAPIPPPAQVAPPPPAAGAWQCTCGKSNTGNFCAACGKKRL